MPIQQSLLSYISSIGSELKNSKDRIRNLIGSSHWLTDGEHKETILGNVLKNHIPEIFNIGSGFVCYPGIESNSSNQLDVLITHKYNPTLYKLDNMFVVTL